MNHKVCCIFNVGPHYRFPIYKKMSETFPIDFYIGDRAGTPLKTFDYNKLNNYKRTLKRIDLFGAWYWQKGILCLAFKPYQKYIITGEPFNLSAWILLLLLILLRKESIAWTHGWYGRESGVKKIIKKVFFRLFSKIMCYNDYSAKLMVEQGFDSKRIFVIGNSLDSEKQKVIREQLSPTEIYSGHFGNTNPIILYCGRIQKVKRLDIMIELLSRLKEKNIAANIVFVGKDVDNVNLDEMASQKGLSKQVWTYGPCYEEEKLGELFSNATICISPGNVGLTAIHALTYGCPVITHDDFPNQMPEFEAIIPGETGDFFKFGNLDDLTNVTIAWLSKPAQELKSIKEKAYAEIDRKWNVNSQIDVLQNVLK